MLFATTIAGTAAPGDLDPAFAGSGKVSFSFHGGSSSARGVLTQGDGKIVAIGPSSAGSRSVVAVVRYNPDGSRDTSFGGDGEVLTDVALADPGIPGSGLDDPQAIALQSDGKIVVAGSSVFGSNRDFSVVRYLPDGSLDVSFGVGGKVSTDFGTNFDNGLAMRVQGDGKIVVAGFQYTASNNYAFIIVRFNGDGSLDDTFNGTGKVITPIGAGNGSYVAVALQSGGKILVAGSIFGPGGVNGVRVARYTTDGSLDSTFDMDGLVQTVVGSLDTVTSMAIQPGSESVTQPDKLIVAGYTFNGTQELFMAVRYNLNDGSLDNSFDGDGKVTIPIGTSRTARAMAVGVTGVSLQPRKIILGGLASLTATGSGSQMAVVRLNADGSLDATLDQDGILTAQFGGVDEALAMSLAGGKIFLAGDSFSPAPVGGNFAFARFNTDGSLDGTFDGDGKKLDAVGGPRATARGVVAQPDGKLVLAGTGGYFGVNFALARLNGDGTFDSSFGGGDGKVAESTILLDAGNAVTLQPDGKILVAGSRGGSGGSSKDVAVVRYNSDGSLDTSFSGGVVTTPVGSGDDAALAVALQSDGKIVVAGYGSGTNRDIAVVRFNPNGSIDSTFDFDGQVFAALSSGEDEARAVAVLPDGKIVIAGLAGNTPRQFFVARLNPNGSFDASFDGDGVAFTSIGPGDAEATGLVVDSLGRTIVSGFASNGVDDDFAVVRYLPNGSLDALFNNGGVVTTSFGAGDDKANAVVLQADGKIVVAGGANTAGPANYAVARFNPDGSLDSGYGNGGRVMIDFFPGIPDLAYGIALDSNGNAVVAGEAMEQFGVAKIDAGPLVVTRFGNISTRMKVETGDNVLIGGFIVTGTQPKKVLIRAIGPSLAQFFSGVLGNPALELFSGNQLLDSNDNWVDSPNKQAIIDSTIPPSNDLESAIVATLPANGANYTAIVRGVNNTTGTGVVEAYDLDSTVDSKLANISTRGFVQTGDNVLIAGTIVIGTQSQKVIIRAIGPSLPFAGRLENPTLELRDGNGGLLEANDNWVDSSNKQAIIDSTIPPSNDLEAAIVRTLTPAPYTAIVRGVNDTTGIAVVEIYGL